MGGVARPWACVHQVEVCKLLLERGAVDCLDIDAEYVVKTGEGAYYDGLSVAGRKGESHLPKQVRLTREFRRAHHMTGLHIAAWCVPVPAAPRTPIAAPLPPPPPFTVG